MMISKRRLDLQNKAVSAGVNDDTPIESLGLTVRLECALTRYAGNTVGQIRALSDKQLDAIPHIGKKSIQEWRAFLAKAFPDYVTLSDGREMTMREYLDMIRAEYDKDGLGRTLRPR